MKATPSVPEKVKEKARSLVNNAIRDKKLIRPTTCNFCGDKTKVEAHHTDYSEPYLVVWPCLMCHRKIHKGEIKLWEKKTFWEEDNPIGFKLKPYKEDPAYDFKPFRVD